MMSDTLTLMPVRVSVTSTSSFTLSSRAVGATLAGPALVRYVILALSQPTLGRPASTKMQLYYLPRDRQYPRYIVSECVAVGNPGLYPNVRRLAPLRALSSLALFCSLYGGFTRWSRSGAHLSCCFFNSSQIVLGPNALTAVRLLQPCRRPRITSTPATRLLLAVPDRYM